MLRRNSILLIAIASLSGCADYMNHRDSVTLGAGNAMETNIGIHTIDPFPPVADDTDIDRWGNEIVPKPKTQPAPAQPAPAK